MTSAEENTKNGASKGGSAKEAMEAARLKVLETEKEVKSIKNLIRDVALEKESSNELKISIEKAEGLPETAKPKFHLQLSSPVEELTISKLYDPLDKDNKDSIAIFSEVDIARATLTLTVQDEDMHLGSSDALDISPLCKYDVKAGGVGNEVTTLRVDIFPDAESGQTVKRDIDELLPSPKYESDSKATPETEDDETKLFDASDDFADAVEHEEALEKEDEEEENAEEKEQKVEEKVEEEEQKVEEKAEEKEQKVEEKVEEEVQKPTTTASSEKVPICTITLRAEFTPSRVDRRTVLYERLNEASKRKALAVEELRHSAADVSRSDKSTDSSTTTITKSGSTAAVKSGFLNKKTKKEEKKEDAIWYRFYQKTIGPQSMFRKVFPIAKNYCLFFGIVALIHYKGEFLEIPAPV